MRIYASDTVALPVDYQERLIPAIHESAKIVEKTAMLIRGLRALDVPIVVSRQYPKGLGDIVLEIKDALGSYEPWDKLAFSACGEPVLMDKIKESGKKNVIVCGVEAHVCVIQSVIDLIQQGYTVILVVDCIGSRTAESKKYAIKRAVYEGAIVTTAEAILFEMTEKAGTDVFKTISKLVK